MWELDIERDIPDDDLVVALSRALGIDRERIAIETSAVVGDFARHVTIVRATGVGAIDTVALCQALARSLDTRVLVDDAEADRSTAMLVSASDVVRVRLDDHRVIVGLVDHVDTDDIPDRLVVESSVYARTRGQHLARLIADLRPLDADASPEVQDAHHDLMLRLRDLVHRRSTPDDDRALRRTCAALQRANLPDAAADIMRCADVVLAAPWDPDADA